ncbi:hypothetical protein ACFL23_01160 [Patescibacteria group bacterium]
MIKKILCIIVIFASIVAIYRIVNKKSSDTKKNIFLEKGWYRIKDIISMNSDNLYEMANYRIRTTINEFKEIFPWEVDIQIKPLSEKIGSGYVLHDEKENDKLRIILYKKNNSICTLQINVCLYGYISYTGIKPCTFNDLMNSVDTIEILKKLKDLEKDNNDFSFLTGCNPEIPAEIYNDICTVNEYLAIYNAAMLHYSLLFFYVYKIRTINRNPFFKIINTNAEEMLNRFLKNSTIWPLVFTEYHFKKHRLRYELLYYRNLFIFLLLIVALIFFFIQFFRKNLKLIIKEELAKNGITLTTGLVYKIFWQNWKCLFYQARNSEVQAKINLIAEKIANDIRNKNMIRRAKELWNAFDKSDLSEQVKKMLLGSYKKAMGKKTSFPNRSNAVNILSNHLFLLFADKEDNKLIESNQTIIKTSKKEKGISEKEKLYSQIHCLINVQQPILEDLSVKNLYHLLLAIEILSKIDSLAIDKMLAIGVKKMLLNDKFISALHTEDKFIIKECLNFKRLIKTDNGNGGEKVVIDNKLLAGKKVIIIGGRMAHKKRKLFVNWTYNFNANTVKYISSLEHNKIDHAIKNRTVDLIIFIRPLEHSIVYKIKNHYNNRFVVVSNYYRNFYLKELNNLLVNINF